VGRLVITPDTGLWMTSVTWGTDELAGRLGRANEETTPSRKAFPDVLASLAVSMTGTAIADGDRIAVTRPSRTFS